MSLQEGEPTVIIEKPDWWTLNTYSGLYLSEEVSLGFPLPGALMNRGSSEGQGEGKNSGHESTHPHEKGCRVSL